MTDKPTKSADQLDDLTDEVLDNDFDADEGETWEDQNAESQSKPKKKSSLFTLILIVGGAMVFAGIIYVQMGSLPPTASQTPMSPEQTTAAVDPNATAPAADQTTPPQPTANVPMVPEPPAAPALTPMPSDSLPPEMTKASVVDPPAMLAVPAVPTVDVTEVPNVDPATPTPPVVAPSETPAVSVPSDLPVVPTATPAMDLPAVTAPSTPADNERLQALEAKINDLSIRLTKTTDVTAPVSADPDMVERLESMAARLAVLEERLADMPTTPSIPAPRPTSESQTAPAPAPAPMSYTEREVISPDPVPVAPRITYVLRAVSNDKAYISQGSRGALITVRVGDRVEGLGTVRDIRRQSNGKWQIVTTTGRINQ